MVSRMKEHRSSEEWTRKLFVEHANIFLKIFKREVQPRTVGQVEGLLRIFSEFGVPKRGRVLDLACGIGRHAVPLAKRGYRVVGLDLSPRFIKRALSYARREHVASRTKFHVADARQVQDALKDEQPFDAIISIWSSIGYYGEEEDLRMFKALKTLAAPHSLLVVDTANRDRLDLRYRERGIADLGDIEHHEQRKLNLERSEIENQWSFYEKKGKDLKFRARVDFSLRVYSLHELRGLLERAGWHYAKCYGNFDMQPFTVESNRIIACCRA